MIKAVEENRICKQCGVKKEIDKFHLSSTHHGGHKPICAECYNWNHRSAEDKLKEETKWRLLAMGLRFCPCCNWVKNSMEDGYYRLYAYDKKDNKSTKLLLDYNDAKVVIEATGGRWTGIVTNHVDQKKLKIRTASCGLPHCMCLLSVVKEMR